MMCQPSDDKFLMKWAWLGSYWETTDNISETVQHRCTVTMED